MMLKKEAVILLHGIGLSKNSLFLIKHALKKNDYAPLAITYPSTKKSITEIAFWLRDTHLTSAFWDQYDKIHFVTHSMGGLVTRRYLTHFQSEIPHQKIGSVVMLGPPNQGSEITDMIGRFLPYRWLFGPAGLELSTTCQESNADNLYYDVGVIAGNSRWLYPLSSLIIPGPNDGRVAVERTKLKGIKDHIILRTSHTLMIYRPIVIKNILSFLKNGVFHHGS